MLAERGAKVLRSISSRGSSPDHRAPSGGAAVAVA